MRWNLGRIVPVVAHPVDRRTGTGVPAPTPPEVGLRWGKPGRASYQRQAAAGNDPASEGGFNTVTQPQYKRTKKVHDISPVYAEFDVLEVPHAERPNEKLEVAQMTRGIFKLGEVIEKKIIGVTFVAGTVAKVHTEDVKILRYLSLEFDTPRPKRSTWKYADTWGEYPPDPEEPSYGGF